MTPFIFTATEPSGGSDSPKAPSLIDSEEEARKEAEALRKWNEEQKRKREEEARRGEESANIPVAAGSESTTSSARDTPVEAMEAEETLAPKERYRIPKKSAKEIVVPAKQEREQGYARTLRIEGRARIIGIIPR